MSISLILFWIAAVVFAADVMLGKIGILTGGAVHPFLGELEHFAILALAAVLLTIESLRRETRRNGRLRNPEEAGRNGPQAPSKN